MTFDLGESPYNLLILTAGDSQFQKGLGNHLPLWREVARLGVNLLLYCGAFSAQISVGDSGL